MERVVAETLSPRLDEIRTQLGWNLELEGDEDAIRKQVAKAPSDRSAAFTKHAAGVSAFRERLNSFSVLDPACGSGAFLIHTLEFLLRERKRVQRELALVTGGKGESLFEFKADDEIRQILSKNIFGVDINPASVEIARLALWLHTAKSDQPLSNLDTNIVTGNSLVGEEVYDFKKDLISAAEKKKEEINPFNYEKHFAAVFDKKRPGGPGFDCIIGNPPYVKLQNFKKVYPETADFLANATGKGGHPRFKSCQTGAFDLYLPFIERGLELLNSAGRLGYIAPSVWRFNKYAEGLKSLLLSGKHLSRWIDFMSFQVFDEAITYTALQFFTKAPSDHVQIAMAPRGVLADIPDWSDPEWRVEYNELAKVGPWVFASQSARQLIKRLQTDCMNLSDPKVSTDISQGLISGASKIYINGRIAKDRYSSRNGDEPEEVAIESAACLPLISAEDIDPFLITKPNAEIIFPYEDDGTGFEAIGEKDFKKRFPLAYKHLKSNEADLRKRDSGKMDGAHWYTFSRTQNLDKQALPKIVIAGTGQRVEAALDAKGKFATNDKRVYSVYPTTPEDLAFLTGILNSKTCNFVFKHLARPKDGGYFDIETQFLGPLPIPKSTKAKKADFAKVVANLSRLHAERRDLVAALLKRFATCETVEKPVEWLWPTIRSLAAWKAKAPADLSSREKTKWARERQDEQIASATDDLKDRLRPGARLEVELLKGELRIVDDGTTVLDGVFVDKDEAHQTLIDWRNYLRLNPVPSVPDAAQLASNLRCVRITSNPAIAKQIADLDAELAQIEKDIHDAESALNDLANRAYSLSDAELKIVNE